MMIVDNKSFFHTHPKMETVINVPEHHVIVDRSDYELVYNYLMETEKLFMEYMRSKCLSIVSDDKPGWGKVDSEILTNKLQVKF